MMDFICEFPGCHQYRGMVCGQEHCPTTESRLAELRGAQLRIAEEISQYRLVIDEASNVLKKIHYTTKNLSKRLLAKRQTGMRLPRTVWLLVMPKVALLTMV